MALFKGFSVIDKLDELLDHERRAILRGDLDEIVRAAPEKARLLSILPESAGDAARIQRLRDKADRNQELLAAVARGIKNAVRRLAAMNAPEATLRTYDRGGNSRDMVHARSNIEKRA